MHLSRGDVVLNKGEFALVWENIGRSIRIFPINDAEDGASINDMVIGASDFCRITGMKCAVMRLTASRMEPPNGWLRIPELCMSADAIAAVNAGLHHFAAVCGVQEQWPFYQSLVAGKAPILAS